VDYQADVAAAVREARPGGIDALVDTVNRDAAVFATLAGLVRPGGRAASVVGAADVEKLATDDVTAANVMGSADPADATRAAELADAGTLRVPIQRTYPAVRVADALADFANEHTVGKLAIDLSEL
jgi:NADPH:quinone reductase-like Zn-dependent oxidoreductase